MPPIAKMLMISLAIILAVIGLALLAGFVRTSIVERDERQQTFLAGHVPNPLPDGFYSGRVEANPVGWLGKSFDAATKTGFNNFADNRTGYPFTTSEGPGIRDPQLHVLKIDYNNAQNSFWLRHVLDEIVETDQPGHYLGKAHLRFGGLVFTGGYFSLTK